VNPCLARPSNRFRPHALLRAESLIAVGMVLYLAAASLGCALTSKAELIGTRYFEPELPSPAAGAKVEETSTSAPMELQLGRVTASAYLKSRLVYRASSFELGAYEDRQWTERPEEYLRRAVASSLFSSHGITHALSGDSPTLDVELAAFEEIRNGDQSVGRVTIRYALRDDYSVWTTDSITVDRHTRAGSQQPEDVVAAISAALASATGTLADRVDARLRETPVKAPSAAD
jgi:cholesterol transport system auxiliary component